jgi:hypothetical protein
LRVATYLEGQLSLARICGCDGAYNCGPGVSTQGLLQDVRKLGVPVGDVKTETDKEGLEWRLQNSRSVTWACPRRAWI